MIPGEQPLPPAGLIIELVTPLTGDGALDRPGLSRLLEEVMPEADALWLGSPDAGEGLVLPPAVRRDLLARSLEVVAGRRPLFFGITGDTPEATRDWALAVRGEMTRQAYQGWVILVDLPLWHHSNRGLPRFCREVAEAAGLPLVMLNSPALVSRRAPMYRHKNIRTQVVKKLAALPEVLGVIFQGNLRRFLNYHLAVLTRPDFALYEGEESRFLTRPGAMGVVSRGAQVAPAAWRQVVRACLHPEEVSDDPHTRLALWQESTRLLNLAGLYAASPAALLKAALAARGLITSDTLAPGTPPAEPPERQKVLDFTWD